MGTEGGRVRCSVVSKPKSNGDTERAHKGGQKKQPSEKSMDVMEPRGLFSFLAQGSKGRGLCVGGPGGSRVHKVPVSKDKRNRPPPCPPLHDDRGRTGFMEAVWRRGPSSERNR